MVSKCREKGVGLEGTYSWHVCLIVLIVPLRIHIILAPLIFILQGVVGVVDSLHELCGIWRRVLVYFTVSIVQVRARRST
jgi:hypothetical protein